MHEEIDSIKRNQT
jgi:hypothetical protein